MKDLDFDELDRAVNSLMTSVSKSDTSKPEETEKTLEITPTLSDDAKPSPATSPVSSTPSPAPTPAAAAPSPRAPLAARRGGRFMDVVHPSSDMKTATVPPRPAVSRQGATIAPSSPLAGVMPSLRPVARPAETKKEESPAPAAVAPANEWPDPLEIADFKNDVAKSETPAKVEETPKPEVEKETPKSEPSDAPLTSPFLSGTKVEKRPLGGNSETESTNEPDRVPAFGAKPDTEMTVSDPEAQLPPEPIKEPEADLPEELKGDLMAVEADTTTHQNKKPEEPVKPSEEKPASEPVQKAQPTSPSVSAASPSNDEKLLTTGPTSIAQQYREEPSTGDQDNGAIYDTDTYHQPLAHPAKKKFGWLWIVWIVVILLLGAGAGAALYLSGIV